MHRERIRLSSRRKVWLFRIIAGCFALLVTLPVCELAIRITLTLCYRRTLTPAAHKPANPDKNATLGQLMQADPNPKILYRFWPEMRARYLGFPIVTNAMGFRDDLVTTSKPPHTLRVVGLGDSTMFGFGLPQEMSYFEVLEAEFRHLLRGRMNVEFVNTGVPGYNAMQEVERFFQTGLKLDPDVVLIQADRNDLEVPLTATVRPNFLFARYLFLAHPLVLIEGNFSDLRAFFLLGQRERLYNPDYPNAGWKSFRESYRRLAEVCRQRRIPLLGLMICEDLPPLSQADSRLPVQENILKIWRECGITPIQTFQAYETKHCRDQQDWIDFINSTGDPHPNHVGHALIAQTVLPFLRDALLKKAGIEPASLDQLGGLGNTALRQMTAIGLHQPENWDGYRINWSGPEAHFHFIPGGGNLVLPLMVSHPDVSAAKPVKITIRVDGIPTARHPLGTRTLQIQVTKAGYLNQVVDIRDLDGCPLELTLKVDRTFQTDKDPRPLGVGIYPLSFLP